MFILKGKIQHYDWGGDRYIPNLLGGIEETKPCAEYWLGAHDNAPSTVFLDNRSENLNDLISKDPIKTIGHQVNQTFGRLPYLFKVLDVKKMLSIQVHPTKEQAEKGFEAENQRGIPTNAPNRNYKDDNHKPEIMIALSDFWLLHGFKPLDQLKYILSKYPSFKKLASLFDQEGLKGLYQYVMTMSDDESNQILRPIVSNMSSEYKNGQLEKAQEEYWAAKACIATENTDNQIDRGIFSIFFFNLIKIEKGDAIFQGAGVPHAYLEGQNIELMANSDNVLRGGLTPKHIDVDELLQIVKYDHTVPKIIKGSNTSQSSEQKYLSPAPDFELSMIHVNKHHNYQHQSGTAEIILVHEGTVEAKCHEDELVLQKGDAVIMFNGDDYQFTGKPSATLYKASTPLGELSN